MNDHSPWSAFRLNEHQLLRIQMVLTTVAFVLTLGCVLLLVLV